MSSVSSNKLFLLGAEALAMGGELQPLEDGVFVRELVDDCVLSQRQGVELGTVQA